MEPRQPGSSGGFEHKPFENGRQIEAAGSLTPDRIQSNPEFTHESLADRPQAHEQEFRPPVVPSLPAPLPSSDDGASVLPAMPTDDSAMLAAEDQDLIEKEWVDKAKKIINETRDDPYRREQEVSKLQIEYIRKRYGREIGETDSQ